MIILLLAQFSELHVYEAHFRNYYSAGGVGPWRQLRILSLGG
jgi:hypothetical protein